MKITNLEYSNGLGANSLYRQSPNYAVKGGSVSFSYLFPYAVAPVELQASAVFEVDDLYGLVGQETSYDHSEIYSHLDFDYFEISTSAGDGLLARSAVGKGLLGSAEVSFAASSVSVGW